MSDALFQVNLQLFVRPVEGDSLRQTLVDLVAARGVARITVRGRGRIDAARLERAAEARTGPLEVIQLTGHATANETHLTLAALDASGQLVAGTLLDCRAVDLELTLELLEAVEDAVASTPSAPTPSAPKPMLKVRPAAPSWTQVAAASSAAAEAEDEHDVTAPMPRPGDHLEHASFGACTVEKVDADEEFVMVRNPSNRLMRLSLDILRLELLGEEGGRRRYRARVIKTADKRR